MSEELLQESALESEVLEEAGEVVEQEQPEVNEVEERAKRMGWKPQEEYKGDPERWTDAETFVKVGEERLPVMKENYRKLEDKYADLERQVKAQTDYQKHMAKVQYERAKKELQEQKKQAVENADTELYERLEKQEEQINNDYSPKEVAPVSQEQQEVAAWQQRNPWFANPNLQQKAVEMENAILGEESFKQMQDPFYQPMPLSQRLEEVTRRMLEANKPKDARRLPSVEGARQTSGKKAAKTWSDIPTGDREKAEQWIKAGILSKEDYVKDYFGE